MVSSLAWGGAEYPVSQGHGIPGFRPDWYEYSKDLGYPAGYHLGLDVPMPKGTPIYALNYGKVIDEGFSDSFRPYPVWIETVDNPKTPQDETGYVEIYGHLSQEVVNEGQMVTPGQLIGYSGEQTYKGTTTPDGSGEHIHFELRKPKGSGYVAVDPTNWLEGAEGTPQSGGGFNLPDFGIGNAIGDIQRDVGEMVRRLFIAAIGLGLVWIGLNKVLETHTGFSPRRSVKKVAKTAAKVNPVVRKVAK